MKPLKDVRLWVAVTVVVTAILAYVEIKRKEASTAFSQRYMTENVVQLPNDPATGQLAGSIQDMGSLLYNNQLRPYLYVHKPQISSASEGNPLAAHGWPGAFPRIKY